MNTIYQLPLRNDVPWYAVQMQLSGVVYTLVFRYNVRSQRWIMDVRDPSENYIVVGLPILIDRDVAGQYVMANIPAGPFFAIDNTGTQDQPTVYSFGNTHSFYYQDPDS